MPSDKKKADLFSLIPESWLCIDCGVNTAPGLLSRAEAGKAIEAAEAEGNEDWRLPQSFDEQSELYAVRDEVWEAAGMEPMGGCLCIGCLEKRLGRKLRPRDFLRDHPFNLSNVPGTPRLMKRRGRQHPKI